MEYRQAEGKVKMRVLKLTLRQFKLLQRSSFSNWQACEDGHITMIKELLAKYTSFVIRSDGALLGVMSDSVGRSKRTMLDPRFVDERGFKELQFQFPSFEEEM